MPLVTRTNHGKQTGLFVAELGNWMLRQTGADRYKLAANAPVNGKANYAFGVKETRIDTHAGLDVTKLRDERPDLYKAVEAYFKDAGKPASVEEESDPYGDLAISRKRKLIPEQNWRRGLLQMRRIEFEHVAAQKSSIWESGVRMLWAGIFKTRITDKEAEKALHWITQRRGYVDLNMLLQIEQEYYAGKYGPHSSTRLEERLEGLAGANDFDNEEETEDGRERIIELDSRGVGEREPEMGESVPVETITNAGNKPESASLSGAGNSGHDDSGRAVETDPFSAFQ